MKTANCPTLFFDVVSAFVTDVNGLYNEAIEAFKDNRLPDEEFEKLDEIYDTVLESVTLYMVGEISENDFLRNLYNKTKEAQMNVNTIYTNSAFDLLSTTYVELAEINLCIKP